MILPQEAGASENNRKGIAKATPKIESIYILNFYICLLCLQSSATGSFLQT